MSMTTNMPSSWLFFPTTRRRLENSPRTSTSLSATLAVEDADASTASSTPISSANTNTTNISSSSSSPFSSSSPDVRQQFHLSIQVHPCILDGVLQVTSWICDTLNQVVDTLNRSYIAKSVVERLSVLLLLLELGRNHITFQFISLIENHIHQYAIHINEDQQQYDVVTPTSASSTSAAAMLQNMMMMSQQHHHHHTAARDGDIGGISSTVIQQATMPTQMPLPPPTCLVWLFPILTAIASCFLFASLFVHSIQSIQQQQQQYHQYNAPFTSNGSSYHHHSSETLTTAIMGIGLCTILVVMQCLVPLCLVGFGMACLWWHVLFSPEMTAQILTIVWILSAIGSGYLQCFVYTTFGLESDEE